METNSLFPCPETKLNFKAVSRNLFRMEMTCILGKISIWDKYTMQMGRNNQIKLKPSPETKICSYIST